MNDETRPNPADGEAPVPAPAPATDTTRPPRSGGGRAARTLRRGLTWLLILLTAVGVVGTSVAYWADSTIFDTDAYVALVAPIPSNPAVVESVSTQLSERIVDKLDVERIVNDVLPGPTQGLAGLVTAGIQSTIERAIATLMVSPQFETAWIEANRALHTQLVAILHGDAGVLQASGGVVSLNVFPLIAKGIDVADSTLTQATGRDVQLPTLTDPSDPAASRAQIEQALGITLSPDFGVIPIAQTQALERARMAIWLFETSIIVSGLATLLLAILAVAVAIERRKALLQVVVASGIGLAVAGVTIARIDSLVTDLTPSGIAGTLGQVTVSRVMDGFDEFALVLVVIASVLSVALYLAGRPAWIPRWGRSLAERVGVRPSGNRVVRFVAEHIGELRFVGYAIAIAGLLLVPIGQGAIVGVLGTLVVYQLLLTVVRSFRPAYIRAAEDAV